MTGKKISDEEKKLFRDAVSRITSSKNSIIARNPAKTKSSEYDGSKNDVAQIKLLQLTSSKPISGEENISFAKTGVQHKLLMQLRQGKLPISAILDLHHYTVPEAIQAVDAFLQQCSARRTRYVCIIHGKGTLSKNNLPILKNAINAYLREHSLVLAFHSAKGKHGGTGAVYVLVKSKP